MNDRTQAVLAGDAISKLRVIKKLATGSRGAIKLARQFGGSLVCVRHRVDAKANMRYTTVELVVEQCPIQPRQEQHVHIRVEANEYALRQLVRAAGATWDPTLRLWKLPKRVVTVLRLAARIVKPM